jgi:Reverse transcriptase (RNA-dependent DNA polymerase)
MNIRARFWGDIDYYDVMVSFFEVDSSMYTEHFSTLFKSASVTPLLKKPGLDKSLPSNYRPISNLNNISKILERLFLNRIQPSVVSSSSFNQFQFAYRPRHSTETCLLATLDSIFHSSDSGSSTLLVSLISAPLLIALTTPFSSVV